MSSVNSNGRVPERFAGDQGATLVEYAFLLALIALVCVGAMTYFGQSVGSSFSTSASSIISAGP